MIFCFLMYKAAYKENIKRYKQGGFVPNIHLTKMYTTHVSNHVFFSFIFLKIIKMRKLLEQEKLTLNLNLALRFIFTSLYGTATMGESK